MAEIVPNRVPCGKKPEPQPIPPTPEPATGVCDLKGVLYFKLDSGTTGPENWFVGDRTKYCGLLGNEIDQNFYFLRAMDIESAYTITEGNRKYLILKRFGCDWGLKVDLTDEGLYNHIFWVEDGYIHVKYPDGTEDCFRDNHGEGEPVKFLVDGDNVRIVTNSTIDGDGTFKHPIGVDPAYLTGTYAPADFFADLTCTAATLDDFKNIGNGHAVVTKENANRFGALYTYDQAENLNRELASVYGEGGWRVPTKEDWAKLLNWAEDRDEYRNHDSDQIGKNFGCVAGARLKSENFWSGTPGNGDNNFGFSIYPVGLCAEDANTAEPPEYGFDKLYQVTEFWSQSELNGSYYTRSFSYGHDDVAQLARPRVCRFSVRLVRDVDSDKDFDYTGNVEILNTIVPTVLTTDGTQEWTSVNVGFAAPEDAGQLLIPSAWKDVDTNIPAVSCYVLCASTEEDAEYEYRPIEEYEIPSTASPAEFNSVEEALEQEELEPYILIHYTIHLDIVAETKFYYNAWDGKKWHRKMMREGESVVLLREDYGTGCDTAATPYVTSGITNHEWRVRVDEKTGLDELIDTVADIKEEFYKEFRDIRELISGITENLENLSGVVMDMWDQMASGMTDLQDEIDRIESGCGLDADGNFIVPRASGLTSGSTSIRDAVAILDDVIAEDEEVAAAAFNDLNRRMVEVSGTVKNLGDELDAVEDSVGLDQDGRYTAPETGFTSASTTVKEAIEILDHITVENEEIIAAAFNDINRRVAALSGNVANMDEELAEVENQLENVKQAIPLNDDGTYKPSEGNHTSGATNIEEEILAIDEALTEAEENLEELKNRSVEAYDTTMSAWTADSVTYVKVNLGDNNPHLKFDENGIYFDGDFKDTDVEDQDIY